MPGPAGHVRPAGRTDVHAGERVDDGRAALQHGHADQQVGHHLRTAAVNVRHSTWVRASHRLDSARSAKLWLANLKVALQAEQAREACREEEKHPVRSHAPAHADDLQDGVVVRRPVLHLRPAPALHVLAGSALCRRACSGSSHRRAQAAVRWKREQPPPRAPPRRTGA